MAGQSFVVYAELEKQIDRLTDEQVGQLFRAMFQYNRSEEPFFTDPMVGMAFDFVRPIMDRNREKYEAICERNRQNAKKAGAPKGNQNARKQSKQSSGFFGNPKQSDNENENENGNVPENEPDNAPDNEKEERAAAAVSFFRENFSGFSDSVQREIEEICDRMGEEVVKSAMQTAIQSGKKSWGYCKGILKNWKEHGKEEPVKKRSVAPEPWPGRSEGPDEEEIKAAREWRNAHPDRSDHPFQWACGYGRPCIGCRPECEKRVRRTPEMIRKDLNLLAAMDQAEKEGKTEEVFQLAKQLSYF